MGDVPGQLSVVEDGPQQEVGSSEKRGRRVVGTYPGTVLGRYPGKEVPSGIECRFLAMCECAAARFLKRIMSRFGESRSKQESYNASNDQQHHGRQLRRLGYGSNSRHRLS